MKIKNIICSMSVALVCMMNGNCQNIIDLHSHVITEDYLQFLKEHDALMDEGFPIPSWNVQKHLEFMQNAGIETSVLTMVAPHPYFGDIKQTIEQVRKFNDYCAELKENTNGKFKFCATLPLPDIDAAIKETRYVFDTLHADGVKLATNVYGQYLGDEVLDTLFSVLNEYHAVVIIHPHRPVNYPDNLLNSLPLALYEYPAETSRAICNMIARNVLARYNNIKIVVPHSGAYIPLAIKRMQSIYPIFRSKQLLNEIDFQKNLDCLWYDLAGNTTIESIKTMLQITTVDHILYGSDYPYADPRALINNANRLREELKQDFMLAPFAKMILSENARNLFSTNPMETVKYATEEDFLIRIAEIEVRSEYLNDYMEIGKEIAQTSMEKENGVICLLPLQSKDNPTHFRILEIYRNATAYQNHITTEHFLKYKQLSVDMVKSLELIDMQSVNYKGLSDILKKLN